METRELDVELVYPNPKQPRTVFEPRALEELAASIKSAGQLQPIRVRPDGSGRFLIVMGERRFRAICLLGWRTIVAVIDHAMTEDAMADAAIIENLQRKDISPLEEARAFQRRLDTGLSVEELAARLGLKQPWRITERTALLRLIEPMQMALSCGALTPSQAFEMSKLSPENQKRMFDAIGEGRCGSYAELRRTTETLLAGEQQVGMFAEASPPNAEEKIRATRLEKAIDQAAKAVGAGFDGNDCVALRRISPLKAEILVDQLTLMEKALREIRLNLSAACVAAGAGRKAA